MVAKNPFAQITNVGEQISMVFKVNGHTIEPDKVP